MGECYTTGSMLSNKTYPHVDFYCSYFVVGNKKIFTIFVKFNSQSQLKAKLTNINRGKLFTICTGFVQENAKQIQALFKHFSRTIHTFSRTTSYAVQINFMCVLGGKIQTYMVGKMVCLQYIRGHNSVKQTPRLSVLLYNFSAWSMRFTTK